MPAKYGIQVNIREAVRFEERQNHPQSVVFVQAVFRRLCGIYCLIVRAAEKLLLNFLEKLNSSFVFFEKMSVLIFL